MTRVLVDEMTSGDDVLSCSTEKKGVLKLRKIDCTVQSNFREGMLRLKDISFLLRMKDEIEPPFFKSTKSSTIILNSLRLDKF